MPASNKDFGLNSDRNRRVLWQLGFMLFLSRPIINASPTAALSLIAAVMAIAMTFGPECTLAQRPLGTDVSHYQGTINWTTVKNAGITFAWAKATESTGYTDPYYTNNQINAKAVAIPIGGYHFARPSSNPNLTGP